MKKKKRVYFENKRKLIFYEFMPVTKYVFSLLIMCVSDLKFILCVCIPGLAAHEIPCSGLDATYVQTALILRSLHPYITELDLK